MMMVTRGCVGHPTVKVFLVVVQLQVSQAEPRPCGDPNPGSRSFGGRYAECYVIHGWLGTMRDDVVI